MSSTDCPPCAGPAGGPHTLRDAAFGYLHNAPLCMIALDPQTHRPFQANHTFERSIGPLHKFQQYPFAQAAVSDEGRERLQSALTEASKALQAVASSPAQHQQHQSQPPRISIRVPDVEILTLPDGPEGFSRQERVICHLSVDDMTLRLELDDGTTFLHVLLLTLPILE